MNPNWAHDYVIECRTFLKFRQWDECIAYCDLGLRKYHNHLALLYLKGKALLSSKRNEEARLVFEHMINENPRLVPAFRGKAEACLRNNLWEECLATCSYGLKLNPNHLDMTCYKMKCLIALEQFSEAILFLDSCPALPWDMSPQFITRHALLRSSPQLITTIKLYLQAKVALGEYSVYSRIKKQLDEHYQAVNSLPVIFKQFSDAVPAFDNTILRLPK